MSYPKSWTRGELVQPQTIIRVESPNGDDYNIMVVKNSALKDMSPKKFADGMLARIDDVISNVLTKNYPDAHLIKKGITTLSQQDAVYYIVDYTLNAAGRELPMRSYVICSKHGDKQYTLTFRTPKPFFDEYLPIIQQLALGFQFRKVKVQEK